MNGSTGYEPSPTPARAFPALRSMPDLKTPPPEFEISAAELVRRTKARALAAIEQVRAVRLDLADLTRRA